MDFSRFLIVAGLALVALGALWPWVQKIGLGRLPGDIVWESANVRLYIPIVSSLLISAVASLLVWLLRR